MENPDDGLECDIFNLREELASLKEMVSDLNRYLNSNKFHKDPTVQVDDVLRRLRLR